MRGTASALSRAARASLPWLQRRRTAVQMLAAARALMQAQSCSSSRAVSSEASPPCTTLEATETSWLREASRAAANSPSPRDTAPGAELELGLALRTVAMRPLRSSPSTRASTLTPQAPTAGCRPEQDCAQPTAGASRATAFRALSSASPSLLRATLSSSLKEGSRWLLSAPAPGWLLEAATAAAGSVARPSAMP